MNKIAILIPVYNGLTRTKECLSNLASMLGAPNPKNQTFEIVVIDDGSTDGTREWIEQHHLRVHILTGDGNLWWSGAINEGAKYALQTLGANYLLLWNNDIIAHEEYFNRLVDILLDSRTSKVIGSKILQLEKKAKIWSYGAIFNPRTGKKYMIGYHALDGEDYSTPREVDWLTGMGTLIHKDVIEKTGYWNNKDFPQYHGDSDFTFRAKKSGFAPVVYPGLIIYNDTRNTGLSHRGTTRDFFRALTSIRSNLNIRKDFLYYKQHSTSVLAYLVLIKRYSSITGSFIKWKTLNLMGIKRGTR